MDLCRWMALRGRREAGLAMSMAWSTTLFFAVDPAPIRAEAVGGARSRGAKREGGGGVDEGDGRRSCTQHRWTALTCGALHVVPGRNTPTRLPLLPNYLTRMELADVGGTTPTPQEWVDQPEGGEVPSR